MRGVALLTSGNSFRNSCVSATFARIVSANNVYAFGKTALRSGKRTFSASDGEKVAKPDEVTRHDVLLKTGS